MQRIVLAAVASACLSLSAGAASAGVYSDDMAKCLVSHTTTQDNATFVQWVFAALSANPTVKPLTNVTDAQREDYDRKFVAIVQRLALDDCRKETVMALKTDGESAIDTSFGVVGQVAFRGLMSDPATAAQFTRLGSFADKSKWEAVAKEAGIPMATAPAASPAKK